MAEAAASAEARQGTVSLDSAAEPARARLGIAVPLVTSGRVLGTLLLVGAPEALDLDKSDLPVLTGVAAQLAVALDREHLADLHRVRAEHERRRLQAEVQDLRSALQQSQFVFQSAAMTELLNRTRRVATTETTVLITGESGTGKERLAQTVHQLSARRGKPFVIVDCGAIPATLIDSELFGHERGAFTGAQQRSLGRLAQADGGTVLLDEIGELPLDVQSRLLRFVQEKTISMVGGTRARTVDVRIIAATNRRLEDEVRAGRFREDLFYRLNVVRLHIPPLRERLEDVRLLAEHFARAYAAEQRKPIAGFTAAAEQRVLAHAWPGNVRELQNVILQAVVLSESDRLEVADLALPDITGGPDAPPGASVPPASDGTPAALPAPGDASGFDAAWTALQARLDDEVRAAATARPRPGWPLGRWLAADLVLAAIDVAAGVRVRAAERLGLPLTTYARRLTQALADRPMTTRPPSWAPVVEALAAVVAAPAPPDGSLADRVDAALLDSVARACPRPPGLRGDAARPVHAHAEATPRRPSRRAGDRPLGATHPAPVGDNRAMPSRRAFLQSVGAAAAASSAAPAARAADPLGVRDQFPAAARRLYLNSAYIAPTPRAVAAAGRAFADAKTEQPIPLGEMQRAADGVRAAYAPPHRRRRRRDRVPLCDQRRREHRRPRTRAGRGRQRGGRRAALQHQLRPLPRAGADARDRVANRQGPGRRGARRRRGAGRRRQDPPGVGRVGIAPERLPSRPAAAGRPRPRPWRLSVCRCRAGRRHVPGRRRRRGGRLHGRRHLQVAARQLRRGAVLHPPGAPRSHSARPGRRPARRARTGRSPLRDLPHRQAVRLRHAGLRPHLSTGRGPRGARTGRCCGHRAAHRRPGRSAPPRPARPGRPGAHAGRATARRSCPSRWNRRATPRRSSRRPASTSRYATADGWCACRRRSSTPTRTSTASSTWRGPCCGADGAGAADATGGWCTMARCA